VHEVIDGVPTSMTTTPNDPSDPRVTPDPPNPIAPGEEPGPGAEPQPDEGVERLGRYR
jgi:hypothetical protein